MFFVEFVDVVALAAVMASCKLGKILGVIEIVLPDPLVGDGDPGPAQGQLARLGFRHHGKNGADSLLAAFVLQCAQSGVYIAFWAVNGIVKLHDAVDAVADNETPVGKGVFGVKMAAPHVFCAGTVFAQPIGTFFVVRPQQGHGLCGHGGKGQHRMIS